MASKVVVELQHNYDTSAFARFDEHGIPKTQRALGSLYIRSETYEKLGEPEKIKITMEAK